MKNLPEIKDFHDIILDIEQVRDMLKNIDDSSRNLKIFNQVKNSNIDELTEILKESSQNLKNIKASLGQLEKKRLREFDVKTPESKKDADFIKNFLIHN